MSLIKDTRLQVGENLDKMTYWVQRKSYTNQIIDDNILEYR